MHQWRSFYKGGDNINMLNYFSSFFHSFFAEFDMSKKDNWKLFCYCVTDLFFNLFPKVNNLPNASWGISIKITWGESQDSSIVDNMQFTK